MKKEGVPTEKSSLCPKAEAADENKGSVELFAEELHLFADKAHQLVELVGRQALGAVALGLGGVVVHLDHQAVGTGGHSGLGQLRHHPGVAAGVAGVHHHGQVGHFVQHHHAREVEGIAHAGLKGADAPLAEDDVLVAFGHDVLGAHHELLQGVRQAALEQYRLFLAAHGLQQLKVLHIAGTHLDEVHVLEQGQVLGVHDLGHDGGAGGPAGQLQQVQPLAPHPLEGVGGGAGLERAAPQQGSPGGLHPLGTVGDLFLALDAAGARNDGKVAAADLHALHVDDAVVRVELAVGFLVRLRHAAAGLDHGVCQHPALGDGLGVADEAEDVGVAALGVVDLQAHALQLAAELMHLHLGGVLFQYNDHSGFSLSISQSDLIYFHEV